MSEQVVQNPIIPDRRKDTRTPAFLATGLAIGIAIPVGMSHELTDALIGPSLIEVGLLGLWAKRALHNRVIAMRAAKQAAGKTA